jgi:hypothetical protein
MAEFNLWLLILGIAAGAAVTWLVIGTIARNDDEIASSESAAEAGWIARTIEEHGGRAPLQLVEQILSLHRRYLQGGSVMPVPQPDEEPVAPPERERAAGETGGTAAESSPGTESSPAAESSAATESSPEGNPTVRRPAKAAVRPRERG